MAYLYRYLLRWFGVAFLLVGCWFIWFGMWVIELKDFPAFAVGSVKHIQIHFTSDFL